MRAVTIGLALLVSFSFYQLAHRAAVALASQCFAPTVNRRNQRDRHWQLLPAMCALATSSYDALVPSSTRPSARARTEPNADTRWSWRRLCIWDVRLCLGGFAGRSHPSHPTPGSRSDVMAARRNGASESRPSASSWVPSDALRRVPAARGTPSPTPPCSDGNRAARRCYGFAHHRLRIGAAPSHVTYYICIYTIYVLLAAPREC